MYMPTPPDAIGAASEHNQLVSWYTSNEIQMFPLNYFSPFTLTRSSMHVFAIVDIPVDKNKMAFLSTIRI